MIYSARLVGEVFRATRKLKQSRNYIELLCNQRNDKRRTTDAASTSYGSRIPRRHCRNRGYAVEEMAAPSDELFLRMFRVNRDVFAILVDAIGPYIERDAIKARNSSRAEIGPRTRLAVTLRWLAGGSHIDLCFAFGVSKATFYGKQGILWPTIEALDKVLSIGFPLTDLNALKELVYYFSELLAACTNLFNAYFVADCLKALELIQMVYWMVA